MGPIRNKAENMGGVKGGRAGVGEEMATAALARRGPVVGGDAALSPLTTCIASCSGQMKIAEEILAEPAAQNHPQIAAAAGILEQAARWGARRLWIPDLKVWRGLRRW